VSMFACYQRSGAFQTLSWMVFVCQRPALALSFDCAAAEPSYWVVGVGPALGLLRAVGLAEYPSQVF
jgi:hypothetical protein